MQTSKKRTSKEYEDDLYLIYLQNDYMPMMTWETFRDKFAPGNKRIEDLLGYTKGDVE